MLKSLFLCMQDTLYVFGGAKWPSEEIVNELWALDIHTRIWTPLFNLDPLTNKQDNSTMVDGDDVISMMSFQPNKYKKNILPLSVRSHTAHLVGSKMIVLFGLSSGTETFISYIQEYDLGELQHNQYLYL